MANGTDHVGDRGGEGKAVRARTFLDCVETGTPPALVLYFETDVAGVDEPNRDVSAARLDGIRQEFRDDQLYIVEAFEPG
ncbi:hypothetical protein HNR23_004550 [Nocardiopsis mwathae]|uniref:Uncharacterized protein n=1 Tax=Nocardiopsis mwathae TaxID=1472723 RepID=A0A7W9YLQ0_9ACTN|nr:hypothetical protein [Nocardiopsis mwathae]MBB6174490.1 hypothetical protein [Nocardiopsis mwathae]